MGDLLQFAIYAAVLFLPAIIAFRSSGEKNITAEKSKPASKSAAQRSADELALESLQLAPRRRITAAREAVRQRHNVAAMTRR